MDLRVIDGCIVLDKKQRCIYSIEAPLNRVALDNLEYTILFYLVENAGVPCEKLDLLRQWPHVSDDKPHYLPSENALARVVSSLRKKIGRISNLDPKVLIRTIPRKGFILDALVSGVGDIAGASEKRTKLLAWKIILFAGLFLGVLSWWINYKFGTNQRLTAQNEIVEIYRPKTQKLEFAMSPQQNIVAFTERTDHLSNWDLVIRHLYEDKILTISNAGTDYSAPLWMSQDSLLFRSKSDEDCHITYIDVSKWDITESEALFQCSADAITFGMAKFSQEEVLVTENSNPTERSFLKIVDISSGQTRMIENGSGHGMGDYRVFTSPDLQKIGLLTSNDYQSTQIRVFSRNNLSKSIFEFDVSELLFSVALGNEGLMVKSSKGGFQVYSFEGDEQEFYPVTSPHYAPVATESGYLYLSGEFTGHKLILWDRELEMTSVITNDENVFNKGLLLTSGDVFYSSNRTGIFQIWKFKISEKQTQQVTRFTNSRFYYDLSFSSSGRYMALSFSKYIEILEFKDGDWVSVDLISGASPVFIKDTLYFIDIGDDHSVLKSLVLETGAESNLGIEGVNNIQSDNGNIYYSKLGINIIYQFDISKRTVREKFKLEYLNPIKNWLVHDNELYFSEADGFIANTDGSQLTSQIDTCNKVEMINEKYCILSKQFSSKNKLMYIKKSTP